MKLGFKRRTSSVYEDNFENGLKKHDTVFIEKNGHLIISHTFPKGVN